MPRDRNLLRSTANRNRNRNRTVPASPNRPATADLPGRGRGLENRPDTLLGGPAPAPGPAPGPVAVPGPIGPGGGRAAGRPFGRGRRARLLAGVGQFPGFGRGLFGNIFQFIQGPTGRRRDLLRRTEEEDRFGTLLVSPGGNGRRTVLGG